MKIGLDCDDVLADFETSLVSIYNQRHETFYKPGDLTPDHHYWKELGEEITSNIWDIVQPPEFSSKLKPINGSIQGVSTLVNCGAELYIITNRTITPNEITLNWLERNYGNVFSDIKYGSNDCFNGRPPKGEICKELKLDFFVEDIIKNAKSIENVGIQTLLLDKKWNQEFENTELIKKVYSWKDIVDYFVNNF